MRNRKFFIFLTSYLLILGILIHTQPFLQNTIIKNIGNEDIDVNLRISAPEYPGMTAIEWESLECPAFDRHIIMYIPDTYDPNVPSAVIWGLHGMLQNIDEEEFFGIYAAFIQGTEIYQVAPYGNAIVIVPQGYNSPMPLNPFGWDSNSTDPANEDVEFFRWFIEDYLVNNEVGDLGILNINRRRIYIGGYSMGGMINTCAGKIRDGGHYAAMYHLAGGKFFDTPFDVTRKYPAYVTIGSDDTISGEATEKLMTVYETENHPYHYQEYSGLTHMDAMHASNIDPFHSPKTYFEDCWDWLIQWALNEEPELSEGTAEEFGDYYKFSVVWTDADNDDPLYKMAVNIDGIDYSMDKENPNDLDSTDGCVYTSMVSSSVIGEGIHYYYFEGVDGDNYGNYSVIEAGQGPFSTSRAQTETANFTISEVIDKFPVADFLIDKYTAVIGEEIHFTFTGTEGNPPAEFLWNFGDGNTSIEQNPIHSYNLAGNYTVSLTITDYDSDSDFIIKTNVINVLETEPEPPEPPEPPEDPGIVGYIWVSVGIISSLVFISLAAILLKKRK